MNYYIQNDNELLNLIAEGNEDANQELIKKYTGIVHAIAKKYLQFGLLYGIEEKDLIQEGLIGIAKSIETYNVHKNVLFYTYVTICVESSIKTALKAASRKKNSTLNTSISLEELTEKSNINEIIKDEMSDPYIQLEDIESWEEISKKISNVLKEFEYKVFNLKIKGYSNDEIANKLNKEKRSIENAMCRIRNKCKDLI